MTFLNPRKQHGTGFAEDTPWARDGNVTDAYVADPKYTGYVNPGSSIVGFSQAKGSNAPNIINNVAYADTYSSRKIPNAQLSSVGSSYIRIDGLAAAITGTAKPFTAIISAQVPAAPATVWYLWAFTRSISITPAIVAGGASGTTNFNIARKNDAGTGFTSSTVTSGTSPFVHTVIYNGSTLIVRHNRVLTDNAIAFGAGALTVDHFTVGVAGDLGGGYSQPNLHALIFAPSALPASSYVPIENYLLRKLGL